ncbi:MAG TPA: DMT family transporter [Phenylobacterium sp.]|nr:DMT family transporter [Phenylobacterium sp.]
MTPSQTASIMIVTSGAAHAVVNAILKSGQDKMSSRALMDGFAAMMVLPFVFVVPLPQAAWGWLIVSGFVHFAYLFCLIRAFESADMTVAYPIARGVAPALAASVAVGVFGEPITWMTALGTLLVSIGVMTVGLGRHVERKALMWAGATGVSIALYTVLDAQGVRAAPSAPSYIVWIYLIDGLVIGGIFALWRGPRFLFAARSEWKPGLIAGAISVVTYGLALWAFRIGDTPRLAALRETSILFGVGIAIVFLKERVTTGRLAGIAMIAVGAATLLAAG